MGERRLRDVPIWVALLLIFGLTAQGVWHANRPAPSVKAEALPPPASLQSLQVTAFGDPWVLSKLLVLWLQVFDNQPGISIPFRELNYDYVEGWLGRSLDLDPRSQYPMLAATRLYAGISDPARQRQMFEFAYRRFLERPNDRWKWLAHAAIAAKHRLKDPQLALKYAQAVTELATGPDVPNWAKHMTVVVLQDMGEEEAASLLIYSLLESGMVTDEHEKRFLTSKLKEMAGESPQIDGISTP